MNRGSSLHPEIAVGFGLRLKAGQANITKQPVIQFAQIDTTAAPTFPLCDRRRKPHGQRGNQRQSGTVVQQHEGRVVRCACHLGYPFELY